MKKTAILAASLLAAAGMQGAEALWMRHAAISPDGSRIAFEYKGDIYTVGVDGGTATRLTSHPAYESNPVWSPDSRRIAFASDRHGNFDVMLMDASIIYRSDPDCIYEEENPSMCGMDGISSRTS